MGVYVMIFLIGTTIFALATLMCVIGDIIFERRRKVKVPVAVIEEPVEIVEEPAPVVVAPVVVPVVEVMPEIVEQINAEEADALISDTLAMKTANYEGGAGHGKEGIINIGVLNDRFEANDVITLARLKEKGLIPKKVGRMKVLADGILNKPLVIKSESYSIQAIKMIELTGGTVIILRD